MNTSRFVAGTLNLWGDMRLDEREPALRAFFAASAPDLLGVQELTPHLLTILESALPDHERVRDDTLPGWTGESNLFWARDRFRALEHGAEPFGALEPNRRVFWVRLAPRENETRTLLFATVHLTACLYEPETSTGRNPRPGQVTVAAESLLRVARPDEPILFLGDFNEDELTFWRMERAGFSEVNAVLGRSPQPTSPSFPLPGRMPAVDDWIYFRGPLQPMSFDVAHCASPGLPPSDHRPVLATFRW